MTDGNLPPPVRGYAVATTAEWLAAGLTRGRLRALMESGALTRARRGVYVTVKLANEARHDAQFHHAVQVAAARAATGRVGVASLESAALMHGIALLRRPRPGEVTLTRPPGARAGRRTPMGIVFRTADLPDDQVTAHRGIPVTSVARTVVDLARTGSFMAGVVSADDALYRDRTTKAELRSVLSACVKWPGVGRARRVVEFADERAESVLESCARVVFAEHSLPPPELQVELGGERFVGRVDFYWPAYRTVAEADGEIKYHGKAEALAQLERDQLLRAAGFRAVHFTWHQLFREQPRVIRWIQQAFRGEIG